MRVWFMYDCHTFAKVGDGSSSREQMEARARELFAEDGCGSLFARDSNGRQITYCHGQRQPNGRYGISDDALAAFFNRVEEHANWQARG